MFSITISFGPGPVLWRLLFQTEEKAVTAMEQISSLEQNRSLHEHGAAMGYRKAILLTDDFGQQALIERDQVHGVMFEDMTKSQLGNCEYTLHQARGQAKAQDMAGNDAMLRAHRSKQGPSVITPMGGNGMGPPGF